MSSLCDRCYDPGHCCRLFHLNTGAYPETATVEVFLNFLDGRVDTSGRPYPFIAVRSAFPGTRSDWMWRCPKVTPEGRCSIYEERPDTCRVFEPASDRLCCHWRGAETGEGSVIELFNKNQSEDDGPGREIDEVNL